MSVRLNVVTIVVKDYEEALKFYTERMGFEKRMDVPMSPKIPVADSGRPRSERADTLARARR